MLRLSDYGLIGNCRSAALVGRNGSIDWCCLPEFHSPAIFSALLDRRRGGYFSITPIEEHNSVQQYIPGTNVLETIFTTNGGSVKLTDAFVVSGEEEKLQELFPDHEILRIVTGLSGTVKMNMQFQPKVYYGRTEPKLSGNKGLGIKFCFKENSFILLSNLEQGKIESDGNKANASFQVHEGERVIFSFSCSSQSPAILPDPGQAAIHRMNRTMAYWQTWISQCVYHGRYSDWVKRSVLALKLLAHAPSGAIIAAPTTSLPEEIGGERNWDYRYCWLRDASFTVRALLRLGFQEETHAYMNWILHATRLTQPKLQVVYSVFGHARLKEKRIDWLQGYRDSKPVRIGNGAYDQHQLDVYGEVLDAYYSYSSIIEKFDKASIRFMLGLGNVICEYWNKKDNGIWEMRSLPAHHTHSMVMAWVGLDRLIKMAERYQWKRADLEKYKRLKTAIAEMVERHGFNDQLNAYTHELNGETLDASTLVFSLVDYCEASSPKMMGTTEAIGRKLSKENLVYRYLNEDDGLRGREGSFGICSFWLAENLARQGRLKEAMEIFEAVIRHAGPTGLLAEEIDPSTKEMLGNFPQGFTHIGLINAALSINEAMEKKES
jgi:GH15 family glucan-1,4-alpha-glucosidase